MEERENILIVKWKGEKILLKWKRVNICEVKEGEDVSEVEEEILVEENITEVEEENISGRKYK